jgi:DNA polymerase-3 subunit delta'
MFTDIAGHEFQKNILIRAARENIVSHSYLFAGPDGVGKKLVALEFAKILNCNGNAATGEACECGSCKKIEKGIHPDVALVEFTGAKNIKVDQVREEVEDKLFLKPFEGRFKIVIVDESERMNNSAQNAFLKTLEEPPKESVIILITSSPTSLLPTIRSRCQMLGFNPLGETVIAEMLESQGDYSREEAVLASRLSGGSPGKALKLDRELIAWRKELLSALGESSRYSASDISSLADSVSQGSSSDDTERLELAFRFIYLWLRDLVLIKLGSDEVINADLIEEMKKAADSWETGELLAMQKHVEKTWYDIFRTNANTKLALENLFINLARPPRAA